MFVSSWRLSKRIYHRRASALTHLWKTIVFPQKKVSASTTDLSSPRRFPQLALRRRRRHSSPATLEGMGFLQSYRSAVNEALAARIATLPSTVTHSSIAHEVTPLLSAYCEGGKRVRALFAGAGARAFGMAEPSPALGVACELLQASALIHDDIIDDAATRRGAPSFHHQVAQVHRDHQWLGDADRFGRNGAIMCGDVALGLAFEALAEADGPGVDRARELFAHMVVEVCLGQYVDIRQENLPLAEPTADDIATALEVITVKSAHYSVALPLMIGAALAGASPEGIEAIKAFGEPLGLAFQLRDDELGIFGDPALTGKPAGDDLREGKRTVIVAMTREMATPEQRRLLDEGLGTELADDAVAEIAALMKETGAFERHEKLIRSYEEQAMEHLAALAQNFEGATDPEGIASLADLAEMLVGRRA